MSGPGDRRSVIDPDADQRRAAHPEASVWLSASAGSGKTKVLTDRVLRLLLSGTAPHRILCLTFTKAAAAEMANRVTERLAQWTTAPPERLAEMLQALLGEPATEEETAAARRLFARVLDTPGGMKIQTIHSFCESLIARFPLESGVPPHFEVMDDRSASELMTRARDHVLAAANRVPALEDALAVLTRHIQEDQFNELIAALAGERGRLQRGLDGYEGIAGAVAALYAALAVEPGERPADITDAAVADGAFDRDGLMRAAGALLKGTEKTDQPRGRLLQQWLELDAAGRAAGFDTYQGTFFTGQGQIRKTLITKGAAGADPAVPAILEREADRLETVRERNRACVTAETSAALLTLGAALLGEYDRLKGRSVRLDYDDLIYKTEFLLRRAGLAPWVLFKLDGGLDHILIDEAQDTNLEQWNIVAALAEEFFAGEGARDTVRTIFAVGDIKQSIFSFQRADPALFDHFRDHFGARVAAVGGDWRPLPLNVSFRSTATVLGAVDTVFAASPARDGVVAGTEVLIHDAFRQGMAGLVELWPPVGPEDAEPEDPWAPAAARRAEDKPSRRLAQLIAARIKNWIGKEALPARGRTMRAGDVMILLRRRSDFMEEIVSALKAAEVPVAGVDRMMLAEQLAVMDLMALGRFLLLPEDDLTLATLLKSPFIGFDDDKLFTLAHGRGDDSLWRRLAVLADEDRDYALAYAWLYRLWAETDYERPFELFADVLTAPVPAGESGRSAMLSRLGAEADDPLDEFLSLAMAYEKGRVASLQGFLHWMEAGTVEVKRDLEQSGADEVRVMTVHGAKGLQAPVVILPDTMALPAGNTISVLWRDDLPFWSPRRAFEPAPVRGLRAEANNARDEEYRRLLYVAMTRAEDRLYIGGYHGPQTPSELCWYGMIKEALAGIAAPFAFDAGEVIARGWQGEGLRLAAEQEADAKPDGARVAAMTAETALPGWIAAPAPPEETPPKPLAPSRPEDDPPADSPFGGDGGARFKRGLIIHRLLQSLPDLAAPERRQAALRYLGTPSLELDADAQADIADTVLGVLDHPDFADLFGPDSKAEVPIAGTVPMAHGIEVVAGQVDRLVVRDDEVLVLDYKSLRPPPADPSGVPAVYLRQMAAYRAVLRGVWPDRAIRCALLWTENPSLMLLDDALLDSLAAAP